AIVIADSAALARGRALRFGPTPLRGRPRRLGPRLSAAQRVLAGDRGRVLRKGSGPHVPRAGRCGADPDGGRSDTRPRRISDAPKPERRKPACVRWRADSWRSSIRSEAG